MSNYQLFSTRQFLLKFTNQAWRVNSHVYVSYMHRLYLYIYICIIFTKCLSQGSLMRTYLISISHKQRYFFISSKLDMHCGYCINIPFWKWIKLHRQFSSYTNCYDYDGGQLSKLQLDNVARCFSEYLGILGLKVLSNLLHIH
jgi:hypothetical protein